MTFGYGDRWWENKPADLEKTDAASAAKAASTSKDSYTNTIKMSLVKGKEYKFWFKYKYEDPETKEVTLSDSSPIWKETFAIPNLTKAVKNLTLTSGFKSYGVKFDLDPASVQEDVVVFESLTSDFAVQNIVYVGTSTNVTIQASSYAPRWVKVRSRDKWDDLNISEATAGPVEILNSEIDTTKVPKAPTGVAVTPSIDPEDKSGFSIKIDVSWTASTDADTNGYVIRWSPNNPATVTNPLWEYGQVDGKETTKFSITGLTPNTVYYWQVTAKSPFNSISWNTAIAGQVASGSFGPVSDPNAPAGNLQLRSILSIGGKTADLFKIGTGITQSINTSNTITPAQTAGTYNGIILDRSTTNFGHNYWLNTGQFRVGSATSFLYWDGSDVYTTGKINATGGVFTGNLRVTTGSIIAGGIFAQDGTVSGARVVMQSGGLFAHDANGAQSVFIQSSDGLIDARKGFIGGWTINAITQTDGYIQSSNTKIESNGNITLGNQVGSVYPIVRLSATDDFRLWIGSNSSSNAPFKVSKEGILRASGAVISGDASFSGTLTVGTTLADGTTIDTVKQKALQGVTDAGAAASAAVLAKARGDAAYDAAISAGQSATAASQAATAASNAAALKMAASDINTVLDLNTTVINGSRVTTGQIDVARLNITGGTAGFNGFVVDGNGIRATSGGSQTLNISSSGTISLGDSTNGWTVDNQYIKSRSFYADGYSRITLDGWNGSITGGRISGTKIEGNTITGGTIIGTKIQTSSSGTRVQLVDSTIDSMQVLISGTVVGNIFGTTATGGALILQGGSSAPNQFGNVYGQVYVGDTVASIAGSAGTRITLDGAGGYTYITGTNGIYTGSGQNFNMRSGDTTASNANAFINSTSGLMARSTSSIRYKTDIETISYPDEAIRSLRPVKYRGIKDMERGDNTFYTGLIAEEVAEIPGLELLVNYNEDGSPEAINYAGLSVVLADVVRRILDRLDALEA